MFPYRFRKSPAIVLGLFTAFLALAPGVPRAQEIVLGRFSAGDLSGWQPKSFKGETKYR